MLIGTTTTAGEMVEVAAVLDAVWGASAQVVTVEMLTAIAHGGGYVALAHDDRGDPVGASVGFLARHATPTGDRDLVLHSHVTGLIQGARGIGLGRSMKLHQREWAIANELGWIVWTFDPLVRRNAWFNIAVLGAHVAEYLPSFYGTMTDDINTGDESDRLLMAWDVTRPLPDTPRDGATAVGVTELVPTPGDVVDLRRRDRAAVARWRVQTRSALGTAIGAGRPVLGFTRAGDYVIGSNP